MSSYYVHIMFGRRIRRGCLVLMVVAAISACDTTTVSSGLNGSTAIPSESNSTSEIAQPSSTTSDSQSGESFLDIDVAEAIDLAYEAAERAFTRVRLSRNGTKIYVTNFSIWGDVDVTIEPYLFKDASSNKTGVAFEIRSSSLASNPTLVPGYVNELFFAKLRPLIADRGIESIVLANPKRLHDKAITGMVPAYLPTSIEGFTRFIDQKADRDDFEGIWTEGSSAFTLGLYRDDSDIRHPYKAFVLSTGYRNWKPGELKIYFSKLVPEGISLALYRDRVKLARSVAFRGDEETLISMSHGPGREVALVKIYPRKNVAGRASGWGTAWYLGGKLFATAAHVVKRAHEIELSNGNVNYSARVETIDRRLDLAILTIDALPTGTKPFKIGTAAPTGTRVLAIGYPLGPRIGKAVKLTNGVVSADRGYRDDPTEFQMSAAIQPGNSGGPVVALDGRVIGIVVAKLKDEASSDNDVENINYGVKPEYLRALLPPDLKAVADASNELPASEVCALYCKSVFLVTTK